MALMGSGCARCGELYAPNGIRVLAQREGIAFVQLVCFSCQVQTLALVTGVDAVAGEDPHEPAWADGPAEGQPAPDAARDGRKPGLRQAPVISEDDVLEMRSFLAGYEGDARGLFGGTPGEPPAGEGKDDRPGGSPRRKAR
jgi:hypothetical protein